MQRNVILILIFSIIVAFFSIQNSHSVSVSFFTRSFDVSLIVVILGAIALGAIIMGLVSSIKQLKLKRQLRIMKRENDELVKESDALKKENDEFREETDALKVCYDRLEKENGELWERVSLPEIENEMSMETNVGENEKNSEKA